MGGGKSHFREVGSGTVSFALAYVAIWNLGDTGVQPIVPRDSWSELSGARWCGTLSPASLCAKFGAVSLTLELIAELEQAHGKVKQWQSSVRTPRGRCE